MLGVFDAPGIYYLETIALADGETKAIDTVTRFDLIEQTSVVMGELSSIIKVFTYVAKKMKIFLVGDRIIICHNL